MKFLSVHLPFLGTRFFLGRTVRVTMTCMSMAMMVVSSMCVAVMVIFLLFLIFYSMSMSMANNCFIIYALLLESRIFLRNLIGSL